jgi:hypothetical protein
MKNYKKEIAILGMLSSFGLSKVFAQTTNELTAPIVASLPGTPNIFYAMLGQVLNNPSSMFVIAFLCVMAWVTDDTPVFPSRYIKHLCVVAGASIYWIFTSEDTVPKSFPHPQAVFLVNGTICGFIAFVIHQQAVARLINLMRGNPAGTQIQPPNPSIQKN